MRLHPLGSRYRSPGPLYSAPGKRRLTTLAERFERSRWVEGVGVLRFAQDDRKNNRSITAETRVLLPAETRVVLPARAQGAPSCWRPGCAFPFETRVLLPAETSGLRRGLCLVLLF